MYYYFQLVDLCNSKGPPIYFFNPLQVIQKEGIWAIVNYKDLIESNSKWTLFSS